MDNLGQLLTAQVTIHKSHSLISITGLDHRKEVFEAIAVYLVAAIAQCIDSNFQVRNALFGETSFNRDIHNDVTTVIGVDNTISSETKTDERNPWLWEGMSHLLINLSLSINDIHPSQPIIMKTSIHLNVKDHGLDLIALYGDGDLGISAGECKAYLESPGRAITDAASRLSEVDSHIRDGEIRSAISQFRPSLNATHKAKLVGPFWDEEKTYLSLVCCDHNYASSFTRNRKTLRELGPPIEKKLLIPASIKDAKIFFDLLSDEMRLYALKKSES